MKVAILKQRIAHNPLLPIFDSFHIPLPTSLNTIEDRYTRQRVRDRYEQIIERTKSDMILVYIRVAEIKSEEYIKKFEANIKEFNENQRTMVQLK